MLRCTTFIAVWLILVTSWANTGQVLAEAGYCDVPVKQHLEPRYGPQALSVTPIPTEGAFLTDSLDSAEKGASYAMIQDSSLERRVTVTLDGQPWAVDGLSSMSQVNSPRLSIPQTSSVLAFLGLWSSCVSEGRWGSVYSLLSDFGVGWTVNNPGDQFLIVDSPLSGLRKDGSKSRSVGSLPLELYDVRLLSDGRVAVLTGDGSLRNREARAFGNAAEGAIWILAPNGESWSIDAMFGGFAAFADSWIDIPSLTDR